MSSPLTDGTIANGDVIEAVHITQLFSIMADLEDGQAFFRDDVGSANAYQVNFNGSPSNKNQFTAYKKGMLVVFKAANANTGASTLQVVGPGGALSAVALTKGGQALVAGDISANQILIAVYNDAAGGRFDLVGVAGASNLDSLSDVTISSPTSGQVVRHNGSNFVNANLAASDMPAGIDAAKIGGGGVSNTEFGYLDGVTGAIQTQLDGKAASSHSHAAADITSGIINTARLGTGTPSSSTFLRGDGSWAAAGGSSIPIGSVIPYAGSSAPSGWLLCAGQYVSQSTYGGLYTALGGASSPYGVNSGNSTFAVPDLRGRVVAGLDNMGGSSANRLTTTTMSSNGLNASGGEQTHLLLSSQMPIHNHAIATRNGGGGNPNAPAAALGAYYSDVNTQDAGGGAAHNNCQPTLVLNYIIYAGV